MKPNSNSLQRRPSGSLANRIRMKRKGYTGLFILVEGLDDKRLYSKFIQASVCRLVPAYGGEIARGALRILMDDPKFDGAIAVVDADFRRITGFSEPAQYPIFEADSHDAEMMIVGIGGLQDLLHEYSDEGKVAEIELDSIDLSDWILQKIRRIGLYRLAAQQMGIGLTFKNLDFEKFFCKKSLQFFEEIFLQELRAASAGADPEFLGVVARVDELSLVEFDLLELCRGHDLSALLSLALRRVVGSNTPGDVSKAKLESGLRLACSVDRFWTTDLAASLKAWEAENPHWPFLWDGEASGAID